MNNLEDVSRGALHLPFRIQISVAATLFRSSFGGICHLTRPQGARLRLPNTGRDYTPAKTRECARRAQRYQQGVGELRNWPQRSGMLLEGPTQLRGSTQLRTATPAGKSGGGRVRRRVGTRPRRDSSPLGDDLWQRRALQGDRKLAGHGSDGQKPQGRKRWHGVRGTRSAARGG